MTLRDFIRENKAELKQAINRVRASNDTRELTYEELRLWILNDEGLYNWARRSGVRI